MTLATTTPVAPPVCTLATLDRRVARGRDFVPILAAGLGALRGTLRALFTLGFALLATFLRFALTLLALLALLLLRAFALLGALLLALFVTRAVAALALRVLRRTFLRLLIALTLLP